MVLINSYFDFSDYEQPVKHFIDDTLYIKLESARSKEANILLMQAKAQLQEQLFSLGQSN
jgi:hypothetical protein